MRTTIKKPIDVAKLPPEARANLADGTIVRVSLEVLTDENGFTPERAAEVQQAIEEARDPKNLIGPMEPEEALAFLHSLMDKSK